VSNRKLSTIEQPKPVDVQAIEHELTRLWKSATDSAESDAVMRVCTLNLVIVTPEVQYPHVNSLLDYIIENNPARIILVQIHPTENNVNHSQDKLNVWVSARCTIPKPGHKQICGEQITISARGDAVQELYSSIAPFLVADLPVFSWWVGHVPFGDHFFESMVALSDKLILDSNAVRYPNSHLKPLAQWVQKNTEKLSISDINWGRITPWRNLLADFFDKPEYRFFLSKINKVEINYISKEGISPIIAQTLFIVGWLASRLGWQYVTTEPNNLQEIAFIFKVGEESIGIAIKPVEFSNDNIQGIARVCLSGVDENERIAVFTVSRSQDGRCAECRAQVAGEKTIKQLSPFQVVDDVRLINQALESVIGDTIYEDALVSISNIGDLSINGF